MTSETIPIGEQVSKRTHKHEGEPVLTTMLRRPTITDGRAGGRRMEEYYKKMAEHFRTRWEGGLMAAATADLAELRTASKPFVPWEASLDFHVPFQDENMVSICCDITEARGDKRPLAERTAVTWDLKSGAPRTLKSFLPGRRYTRKKLLSELAAQAQSRLVSGESLLDPDCVSKLPSAFSPDRFYLTHQGIAIFFPMYSLGPFAEGIPTFHLPLPDPVHQPAHS